MQLTKSRDLLTLPQLHSKLAIHISWKLLWLVGKSHHHPGTRLSTSIENTPVEPLADIVTDPNFILLYEPHIWTMQHSRPFYML
jgi:hypothetical protein